MLPLSTSQKRSSLSFYLSRLQKPNQMDFQYALWTMLQLLIQPKLAYRHASYHKQTKNHYARDDPAFVVVSIAIVALISILYGMIFGSSLWNVPHIVISSVFIYYLLFGCILASISWFVANSLVQRHTNQYNQYTHSTAAASSDIVEWAYAFDVHCNATFPLLILFGFVQLVLCPIFLLDSRISSMLSCTFYGISLSWYCYLVFLGYSVLPFMDKTEVYLLPIGALMVVTLIGIVVGMNPTKMVLKIFFDYIP